MYYFDIIPLELNALICSKLYATTLFKLANSKTVKSLLCETFWNTLIKIRMPDLDLRYVPNHLYNYKNKCLSVILANYVYLTRTYDGCKKLLTPNQFEKEYSLSDFKDASVITLGYTKLPPMNPKFTDRICIDLIDGIKTKVTLTNGCYIKIETSKRDLNFQITAQDLLNMLVHINCYI